jgi:hypothetical protein
VKIFVVSLVVTLLAASTASAQARADPKAAVSRLLQSIKTSDASVYAEVGPKLIMMATPDFGVPLSLDEARKTFGSCSLVSLSDPKPLDGVPASIVTATMTCDPPLPSGPVRFDFMADGKLVHGIYPGGIERFYPKLAKKMPPGP